jgi:hypothetical protein
MLEIDLFNSGSYARVAEKLICRVPMIADACLAQGFLLHGVAGGGGAAF